jgi:hypothetical protein
VFEYHEGTRQSFSLAQAQEVLGREYEFYRLRSDGLLDRNLTHAWIAWRSIAIRRLTTSRKVSWRKTARRGARSTDPGPHGRIFRAGAWAPWKQQRSSQRGTA